MEKNEQYNGWFPHQESKKGHGLCTLLFERSCHHGDSFYCLLLNKSPLPYHISYLHFCLSTLHSAGFKSIVLAFHLLLGSIQIQISTVEYWNGGSPDQTIFDLHNLPIAFTTSNLPYCKTRSLVQPLFSLQQNAELQIRTYFCP